MKIYKTNKKIPKKINEKKKKKRDEQTEPKQGYKTKPNKKIKEIEINKYAKLKYEPDCHIYV